MRNVVFPAVIVALAGAGLHPVTALADSIVSSANPSVVGQTVTFTATFAVYCADGARASFTVDGTSVAFQMSSQGPIFTAAFSTSSLSAGTHTVAFTWSAGVAPDPTCGGTTSLTQTVNPPAPPPAADTTPAPTPAPPVEPAPSPSAQATAPPTSPAASPARLKLTAGRDDAPTAKLVAAGALVLVALGVIALRISRRRVPRSG
jgi:hypothetical protein